MTYRWVSRISQESGFPNSKHQGTFGMTARDWLNTNLQAVFKLQGRLNNLSASAGANAFVAMTKSLASNKEIVEGDPRKVEEMVPMEMGNDDIFLERGGTRRYAIAR